MVRLTDPQYHDPHPTGFQRQCSIINLGYVLFITSCGNVLLYIRLHHITMSHRLFDLRNHHSLITLVHHSRQPLKPTPIQVSVR